MSTNRSDFSKLKEADIEETPLTYRGFTYSKEMIKNLMKNDTT